TRCHRQRHTSCDRSPPATATSQQDGSPQYLLTAQSDKKPRRNSSAPRSIDILCAEFPSSPESSKSITAAGPTKSHAPVQLPRPPRRSGFRRSERTAFLASVHRATIPAMPPRVDPATAPTPSRVARELAPATLRFACRTGTPRQKTAIPARADPSRRCTHSPAKSSFLLFLSSLGAACALSPAPWHYLYSSWGFSVLDLFCLFRDFQLYTVNY